MGKNSKITRRDSVQAPLNVEVTIPTEEEEVVEPLMDGVDTPDTLVPIYLDTVEETETEETVNVDVVEDITTEETEDVVVEDTIPDVEETTVQLSTPVTGNPVVITEQVEQVSPSSPVSTDTPVMKFMRGYITAYETIMSSPLPNSEACSNAFEMVIKYALAHQNDNEVLHILQDFMTKYKSSWMSPKNALQMTASAKNKQRISLVYTLMYELINGISSPIDTEYATKLLGGTGLLNYVIARLPK